MRYDVDECIISFGIQCCCSESCTFPMPWVPTTHTTQTGPSIFCRACSASAFMRRMLSPASKVWQNQACKAQWSAKGPLPSPSSLSSAVMNGMAIPPSIVSESRCEGLQPLPARWLRAQMDPSSSHIAASRRVFFLRVFCPKPGKHFRWFWEASPKACHRPLVLNKFLCDTKGASEPMRSSIFLFIVQTSGWFPLHATSFLASGSLGACKPCFGPEFSRSVIFSNRIAPRMASNAVQTSEKLPEGTRNDDKRVIIWDVMVKRHHFCSLQMTQSICVRKQAEIRRGKSLGFSSWFCRGMINCCKRISVSSAQWACYSWFQHKATFLLPKKNWLNAVFLIHDNHRGDQNLTPLTFTPYPCTCITQSCPNFRVHIALSPSLSPSLPPSLPLYLCMFGCGRSYTTDALKEEKLHQKQKQKIEISMFERVCTCISQLLHVFSRM